MSGAVGSDGQLLSGRIDVQSCGSRFSASDNSQIVQKPDLLSCNLPFRARLQSPPLAVPISTLLRVDRTCASNHACDHSRASNSPISFRGRAIITCLNSSTVSRVLSGSNSMPSQDLIRCGSNRAPLAWGHAKGGPSTEGGPILSWIEVTRVS